MAETDLKIKDAPLSTNISGNVRMAGSDGSGKPVAISLLQVYNFVNSTLKNDAYFAPKTDIPSKVSNLTNDLGYITSAALTPYLKKTELPTNVSVFTNDAGYLVKKDLAPYALTANVPTKVSQMTNDSKFVSSDVTDTLAQSIAQNSGDIERLIESKDQLGEAKAISLDTEKWPTMTGLPIMREGDGAPAVIPDFVGQKYADLTNRKLYFAFGVSSVSDWVVMN